MSALDITSLDINESGLNDLLQEYWKKGQDQPDEIVLARSQLGKVIPLDSYYTGEELVGAVELANETGISTAQARSIISKFAVRRKVIHVRKVQNPSHYESDFGTHRLRIVE